MNRSEQARQYLEKFPDLTRTSVLEGLAYLLFVCEHMSIRLGVEYDTGLVKRYGSDEIVQESSGWRISVDQNYFAGEDDSERLYPSLNLFLAAGLELLRRALEEIEQEN